MYDIRHRVSIAAPRDQVYDAVATTGGWRSWWTETVEGESSVGAPLRFFFGGAEPSATMVARSLVPDAEVVWECVQEGPSSWRGTTVTFALASTASDGTVLFTHAGWPDAGPFIHHCSTQWGYFLAGLKELLDGGASRAHPHDVAVSRWA
jgi:uncharacterized protein YndB with AHSA1/START domain